MTWALGILMRTLISASLKDLNPLEKPLKLLTLKNLPNRELFLRMPMRRHLCVVPLDILS